MGHRAECEWGEFLMANYLTTDTDLTAVADAIREKGGTSAPLAFPQGFVDAIDAIETGGGDDYLSKRITNTLTEYTITGSYVGYAAFSGCEGLTSLAFPDVVTLGEEVCKGTGLTTVHLKQATFNGYSIFRECAKLETFVCEKATIGARFYYLFYNCSKLKAFDADISNIKSDMFTNCNVLKTVVLRGNSVCALAHVNNFNNTPFASGKTGGTLYVPQALIESYQSATNWSTILGYTNNQILPIEGSIYETQYADGTPISTT
jgi:hypothetical protein